MANTQFGVILHLLQKSIVVFKGNSTQYLHVVAFKKTIYISLFGNNEPTLDIHIATMAQYIIVRNASKNKLNN